MFKKLFFIFFFLFISIGAVYPSRKENTKLLDYCFSFEKILLRNTIATRQNPSSNLNSISGNIAKLSVGKTRGELTNKLLNQYKNSKNNLFINLIPNNLLCLLGYWIENLDPGTFESILNEKGNKKFNEFKKDVDDYFKNINSEYEIIKKNLEGFF
jgi:hypothetical protein